VDHGEPDAGLMGEVCGVDKGIPRVLGQIYRDDDVMHGESVVNQA
jgi:hypothetical protein